MKRAQMQYPQATAEEAKLKVIKGSGCLFCDLNVEPIKLRRQWVHHRPGRLIVCPVKNLKPTATA